MVLAVLVLLAWYAWHGAPPLEGPADPTDATYIPRPEWYFLGLFQLLKYFPGRWEVIGAMVVPGIASAFLALLPWIDRGPDRDPRKRQLVVFTVTVGLIAVVALTTLGWHDRPAASGSRQTWSLREIGGRAFAQKLKCARCHAETALADPLEGGPSTRGPEWVIGHIADPEMIAPGMREPPSIVHEREAAAIAAYVRRAARDPYPGFDSTIETVGPIFARWCVGCHKIEGDGGTDGPDLTREGTKHDAATLRKWIVDPELVDPDADMPAFGDRLTSPQLDAISSYLASRR
jgi:mono/diheme cytochrome c family protein